MPTVDIISPGGAFTPAAVGDGVTDDAPAFRAFNTWAQGQTSPITLTLGSAPFTFLAASTDSNIIRGNSMAWNVPQPLTVIGNGRNNTKFTNSSGFGWSFGAPNSLKTGDGNWGSSSIFTARLNTVNAGSTALVCKVIANAALFTANTWAMISGIDMQASGGPVNPFYFEYVFITAVDTVGGIITIQSPLLNTYLDSWPVFNAGNPGTAADQGGPATLYVIDPGWNIDVTYESFGIQALGQTYGSGRSVKWQDIKVFDTFGITPSFSQFVQFTNCDLSSYGMEADKDITKLVFDSTTTGQLLFQSSNNQVIIQNGTNVTNTLNGTARFIEIHDSTVNNLDLGTLSFGRTDSFITSNTTFTGTFGYSGAVDDGDISHNLQVDYTMQPGGIIRIPKAGKVYGCRWMIPGTICWFAGQGPPPQSIPVAAGPIFHVLAVTDDSNFVYVKTDWPWSGFPPWASKIQVVGSQYIDFAANTTTSVDDITSLVNACAAGYHIPGTYRSASLTGGTLGNDTTPARFFPLTYGRLISFTVNVTTPYTGTQNPLSWRPPFNDRFVLDRNNGFQHYSPNFDMRTSGKRVITPTSVVSFGLDSGLALPDPKAWLTNLMNSWGASQDITAEYNGNPSVGPVFTFELVLGQDTSLPTLHRMGARIMR
jgi:hypothetical protein